MALNNKDAVYNNEPVGDQLATTQQPGEALPLSAPNKAWQGLLITALCMVFSILFCYYAGFERTLFICTCNYVVRTFHWISFGVIALSLTVILLTYIKIYLEAGIGKRLHRFDFLLNLIFIVISLTLSMYALRVLEQPHGHVAMVMMLFLSFCLFNVFTLRRYNKELREETMPENEKADINQHKDRVQEWLEEINLPTTATYFLLFLSLTISPLLMERETYAHFKEAIDIVAVGAVAFHLFESSVNFFIKNDEFLIGLELTRRLVRWMTDSQT